MARRIEPNTWDVAGTNTPGHRRVAADSGFTLVEMMSSVAVMLVVMSAAWLLLTVSNDNLNRIDSGSQASEGNRAALASFERDLNRSVVPTSGASPVVYADSSACAFLSDVDVDGASELVAWVAYGDPLFQLERHVIQRQGSSSVTPADFGIGSWDDVWETPNTDPDGPGPGGTWVIHTRPAWFQHTAFEVALKNITDPAEDVARYGRSFPVFTYGIDATRATNDPTKVGLITVRLRNGLPDNKSNIVDSTGAFRVIAYVINGY